MTETITADFIIVGGGILGLWLLKTLKEQGYHVLLLEHNTLGGGQTLNSQGIIHGGLKYALQGVLTNSARNIARMPITWQEHLSGQRIPALTKTKVLSQYQYLCADSWSTSLTNFMASKALLSQTEKVTPHDFPPVMRAYKWHSLYRLFETIIDVPSLLQDLLSDNETFCLQVEHIQPSYIGDKVRHLQVRLPNGETHHFAASHYLFTAGQGNKELLQDFHKQPRMQQRPLHMVTVSSPNLPALYAHVIQGLKPYLTISTHSHPTTWYIGGHVAEVGVHLKPAEQIAAVQEALKRFFPQLDLKEAIWKTAYLVRAEGAAPTGQRPDDAIWHAYQNFTVAWPTKLTLVPVLVERLLGLPTITQVSVLPHAEKILTRLPKAQLGRAFWQQGAEVYAS